MFTINGLNGEDFKYLYALSDDQLKEHGAIRIKVDKQDAYPDRITLKEIPVGEYAILLNHQYLDRPSPYRGRHAIFIWQGQIQPSVLKNTLPEVMQTRLISLRAFDRNDMMIEATLSSGDGITRSIEGMLAIKQVEYILAHNAIQGCFSCRISR